MEKKWTKWSAMTSHVIAYRSKELLSGTHAFNFNCFDDFNCVFMQIHCLSVLLVIYSKDSRIQLKVGTFAQNKSSSTLLLENGLANWQSRQLINSWPLMFQAVLSHTKGS